MDQKFTATWYCSMKGGKVGSVDNALRIGDVAIQGYGPSKRKVINAKNHELSAEFQYIRFKGSTYRVADQCDIPDNVDIYQGNAKACINAGQCICSKQSPLPPRNKQNGGYDVQFLGRKVQQYKEYGY